MISTMTKLHLILIFTVIAVALYMYFLWKEIKVFHDEVQSIKKQVHAIMNEKGDTVCPLAPTAQTTNLPAQPSSSAPLPTPEESPLLVSQPEPEPEHEEVEDTDVIMTNEDEDSLSVTSNEIKDILTNIQDAEDSQQPPADVVLGERKTLPDMASMSNEELNTMKYDDLRNYLRKHGVHMKGSKQDLINKVKSLRS